MSDNTQVERGAVPATTGERWALPPVDATVAAAALERLVTQGDVSKLQPLDRVVYYRAVCQAAGLDPLTRPFDYLTLQGKTVLYPNKGAAEQLRQIHGVKVKKCGPPVIDREARLVSCYVEVEDKYGRPDSDTAYLALDLEEWQDRPGGGRHKVIVEAKGQALADLLNKVQTKAKRRATLSLCGLGIVDLEEDDPRVIDARREVIDLAKLPAETREAQREVARAVVADLPEAWQSPPAPPSQVVPPAERPPVPTPDPGPDPEPVPPERPAARQPEPVNRKIASLTERAKKAVQTHAVPVPEPEAPPERVEPDEAGGGAQDELFPGADEQEAERMLATARVMTLRNKVGEKLFTMALDRRKLAPAGLGQAAVATLDEIADELAAVVAARQAGTRK